MCSVLSQKLFKMGGPCRSSCLPCSPARWPPARWRRPAMSRAPDFAGIGRFGGSAITGFLVKDFMPRGSRPRR